MAKYPFGRMEDEPSFTTPEIADFLDGLGDWFMNLRTVMPGLGKTQYCEGATAGCHLAAVRLRMLHSVTTPLHVHPVNGLTDKEDPHDSPSRCRS